MGKSSHVNLTHNKHVDGLAKSSHGLHEEIPVPLVKKEVKKMIDSKLQRICQIQYKAVCEELHIGGIKRSFEHWTWASSKRRKIETELARLRIGHSRLKEICTDLTKKMTQTAAPAGSKKTLSTSWRHVEDLRLRD